MPGTVLLLSGGLDSSTLAYYCKASFKESLYCLSFDYGQKHVKELESAVAIARSTSLYSLIRIKLDPQPFQGSALTTDGAPVPHGHYEAEMMKATIVPNRNAVLLSIAFALAERVKASRVAYAAHAGDHAIYPDCRPEFVEAFRTMQQYALDRPVDLYTPFIRKTKAEIVAIGRELRVPFENTWSCYEGGEIHCGECGTCVERQEAFSLAGVTDPTQYRSPAESVPNRGS